MDREDKIIKMVYDTLNKRNDWCNERLKIEIKKCINLGDGKK